MSAAPKTLGVIFMGGQGKRLGGADKSRLVIGGTSCLDRIYARLSEAADDIIISQRDPGQHPLAPVVADWPLDGESHPALALLACLDYAATAQYEQIITSSVDTPFLPVDYTQKLQSETLSSVAVSGGFIHGLHARWSCAQLAALKTLILDGQRGLTRLHQDMGSQRIEFETHPVDPFLNINRPEDFELANSLAQSHKL